jgi:hypothetical protein
LLSTISLERNVQVLITTHSRHVLDTLHDSAKMLWVQSGKVVEAGTEDQVDMLLELGALDIKEKLNTGSYNVVVLTEDSVSKLLKTLLNNAGFSETETLLLPYNGVTTIHLLKPLIKQIKATSTAAIIVHRDRDFMEPDEVLLWKQEITAAGAEPFVTREIDVEGYFATDDYIELIGKNVPTFDLTAVKEKLVEGESDGVLESYVNGRIDLERKSGNIGKLNYGQLSAAATKKVNKDLLAIMKGKKKLAKLRAIFGELYGARFDTTPSAPELPMDKELAAIARKDFRDGS